MTTCPQCEAAQGTARVCCASCGCPLAIPRDIAARAQGFVGRHAAVRKIAEWLSAGASGGQFLIVKGKPGAGKTAFLAWLAGAGPSPAEPEIARLRQQLREVVSAVHFCQAGRSGTAGANDPRTFAESLSRQLAARFPRFGEALLRRAAPSVSIHITGQILTDVVGAQIGQLN